HLYLFNTDGKLVKQITKGNWVVSDFLGFDPKETKIFFYSTIESPIEQHIYSVDMKSGKITKISSVKGKHSAKISYSGKYIIDSYNNLRVASAVDLLNNRGKKIQTLLEKNDPLKDYNLDISVFPIKGDGGHDLYCRLIKPANFDPSKKYPVLFYVYGGPHSQLVSESWLGGAGYFLSYMAQQGYVVFTMDNRGTANRGFEFESCIHRRLGELEVADQMKGVEYLKSLPYVDADRIGVDGWSYGGFMALSLLLKNPGVFKVAVAGGPVIDWKYYEVMYGERYMDTPQENPEGYKNAALINYVDSLEGKVLILHGSIDPTVVPQNSLQFLKKCIEKGKQVDYFVYPGHEHNVRGTDRIHMMKKIETYFKDNL
ncbi:MAG: S9 family peptidase, partial [Bacteroidia bacterium]|nr:S9 family peptidase [Bacteroidia bacterium]